MLNIEIGDTVELNNGAECLVKEHEYCPDLVRIQTSCYYRDTGEELDKDYYRHVKRIISRNGMPYTDLLVCIT